MKYQKKIALCAILSALNVLVLLFGALLDVLDLTAGAISMLLVAIIYIEIKGYYPWLSWAVTTTLSFLILPNKAPALLFLLLGNYAILKFYFETLPRVFCWICKFAWFNIALTLLIFGMNQVLMLPDSGYSFSVLVYAVGNAAFLFGHLLYNTVTFLSYRSTATLASGSSVSINIYHISLVVYMNGFKH